MVGDRALQKSKRRLLCAVSHASTVIESLHSRSRSGGCRWTAVCHTACPIIVSFAETLQHALRIGANGDHPLSRDRHLRYVKLKKLPLGSLDRFTDLRRQLWASVLLRLILESNLSTQIEQHRRWNSVLTCYLPPQMINSVRFFRNGAQLSEPCLVRLPPKLRCATNTGVMEKESH